MANFNKVLLIGNMTRDPEVRYLPSNQTAVCDFALATNRSWTGADGIKKEEVTFVDCSCYGKVAEIIGKYKKKGDPLFVDGRLKLDQWEKDGIKHSKLKVIIENFQFLNRGQPGAYGGAAGAPSADPAEYGGEPQPAAPRPAYRPPQGRPAAQPPRPPAAAPSGYDPGAEVASMPEDDAPQIKDDDIPF